MTAPPAKEALALFAGGVVYQAALVPPSGRFGDRKVFIACVYKAMAMRGQGGRGGPAAWKARLVEAHQAGLVSLARADLVAAMPAELVKASETRGAGSAVYHFVVVPPAERSNPSKRKATPPRMRAVRPPPKGTAPKLPAFKREHGRAGAILSTKRDVLGVAIYPDGTQVVLRKRTTTPKRKNPASRGLRSIAWCPLTVGGGGAPGQAVKWNPELRTMAEAHGVYAIRDRSSRTVLYVGESHSGRFYRTLTHHFHDPGGKFARLGEWVHGSPARCEVAWWATKSGDAAKRLERVLIAELDPVGNIQHGEDASAAPF